MDSITMNARSTVLIGDKKLAADRRILINCLNLSSKEMCVTTYLHGVESSEPSYPRAGPRAAWLIKVSTRLPCDTNSFIFLAKTRQNIIVTYLCLSWGRWNWANRDDTVKPLNVMYLLVGDFKGCTSLVLWREGLR